MKFIETQSRVMSARPWRCGNGQLFNGDRAFIFQKEYALETEGGSNLHDNMSILNISELYI